MKGLNCSWRSAKTIVQFILRVQKSQETTLEELGTLLRTDWVSWKKQGPGGCLEDRIPVTHGQSRREMAMWAWLLWAGFNLLGSSEKSSCLWVRLNQGTLKHVFGTNKAMQAVQITKTRVDLNWAVAQLYCRPMAVCLWKRGGGEED